MSELLDAPLANGEDLLRVLYEIERDQRCAYFRMLNEQAQRDTVRAFVARTGSAADEDTIAFIAESLATSEVWW